ncbi:hypothetical protein SHKM778_72780 [Streptomyces sp. KM77-8]|uniref:ABC transporter domain-containing protein n=1 Tax=Streptomyces haneummycinicus TaxID=3074435 RepID=A0AAT9HTS5_9ACTN
MNTTPTTPNRKRTRLVIGAATAVIAGALVAGAGYWWLDRDELSQASAADCRMAQRIITEAEKISTGPAPDAQTWWKKTGDERRAQMKDGYLGAKVSRYEGGRSRPPRSPRSAVREGREEPRGRGAGPLLGLRRHPVHAAARRLTRIAETAPMAVHTAARGRTRDDDVITATALTKTYRQGTTEVRALDGVSVGIRRARFTAVVGPSGSGKSTLMHCVAGLDIVTSGSIVLDGTEITGLSDRQLTRVRRKRVGFVFQSFNLLPQLTAYENIVLPVTMSGGRPDRDLVDHLCDVLGIAHRMSHRPAELSGGQQQRVAVARALVARPAVVFADEPTGNLDSRAGAEVLTMLRRSVDELGQTVVMVTHDPAAARYADQVLTLADGRVVQDEDIAPTGRAAALAPTGRAAALVPTGRAAAFLTGIRAGRR